jgi:hypothetical protein
MRKVAFLIAIAAIVAAPVAGADTIYTLDTNLASMHLEQWARHDLNQRNLGLGITAHFNEDWSISGGEYDNSYHRQTDYLLANWTPFHVPLSGTGWSIAAGGTAGLASGYHRDEISTEPLVAAGLVRLLSPRGWSLNLDVVPNAPGRRSGFVGAQVSLPL